MGISPGAGRSGDPTPLFNAGGGPADLTGPGRDVEGLPPPANPCLEGVEGPENVEASAGVVEIPAANQAGVGSAPCVPLCGAHIEFSHLLIMAYTVPVLCLPAAR